MKESEDRFKFVTDLSDMYGMKKSNIPDGADGSEIGYLSNLEFDKRTKDRTINALKNVIKPEKASDREFFEKAVKEGHITEEFVNSNEARAVAEFLKKEPSIHAGDFMGARLLIGGVGGFATGTLLPYAIAVGSRPGMRKLLLNMDRLGIKRGTEEAFKYFDKMVETGAFAAAMKETKEETEDLTSSEYLKDINSAMGDLDSLIENLKKKYGDKAQPFVNQLENLKNKPEKSRESTFFSLKQQPAFRKMLEDLGD